MTARTHAAGFLLPVHPASSIRRIGRSIIDAAQSDPEMAEMLNSVQDRLGNGRVIIEQEHSAIFERVKEPRAVPRIPTAPEWLAPLIAVGYLRAKNSVGAPGARKILEDPKKSLAKVLDLAGKLEPTFLGELLVETTLAARDDPEFAQALHDGATEYRALVDDLYGHLAEADRQESSGGEGAPTAIARMASQSGGGGGSCTACRTDPSGQRQCEPISCWVIVVIIVIIVVTK